MNVAIVKYNAGNIQSVLFALERIGIEGILTDDPDFLKTADKVIFPGVGEARSAMQYLHERGLDEVISGLTQPVLGICLGLQLMCRHSEENDAKCLDLFELEVKLFPSKIDGKTFKVPQIGWNSIQDLKSPLFDGIQEGAYVYFVHSYFAEAGVDTIATSNYSESFSAALHRDNFFATQFHPEKSGPVGQQILKNFIDL